MHNSPASELMTKKDVAAYLRCSLRQVEILTAKKRIASPIYLGSSSPRWIRAELLASIASPDTDREVAR